MTPHTQGREILPANVKPRHYFVELAPVLETGECAGTVQIELEVMEDSYEISLNTAEMEILSAKISSRASASEPQECEKISHAMEIQTTTVRLKNSLKKGTTVFLTLTFNPHSLKPDDEGFYKAEYAAFGGSKKLMACTNMEPVDARKVFPCFDEPALKATFDIVLVIETKFTALSNMNAISDEAVDSGMKKIAFATTPIMSTYLICVVIGEFNYIESSDFHIPIRVYADPGKEKRGQYALDIAVKTLTLYEKIFGVKFPLPKLDMVMVHNFPGAMENWGLVVYLETGLLFDEEAGSTKDKQNVSMFVQHELAHQWFGNLVTMDFWEGLWLNEGFADWVSWYSSDILNPEWRVWESYVGNDLAQALTLDSLRSSHPIEVPVKRAIEINQIFDVISYCKGSAIIQMISQYLGEDVFFEGIRLYFKKHAYGNTKTSDLWDALSIVSGKDVAKVMHIWTSQVGYPVVKVTETSEGITLQQNRFLQSADIKPEEDEVIYPILTSLIIGRETEVPVQFTTRTLDIPLKSHEFFKLNKCQNGFYRTLYTPERLLKLGEATKTGTLGVKDQMGLIADTGALAASGYQKTSALLGLLLSMSSETSANVWDLIVANLSLVEEAFKLKSTAISEGLKRFKKDLTAPRAHQLGWNIYSGSDALLIKNKVTLFLAAGQSGDKKCIEAAKHMFKGHYIEGDKAAMSSDFGDAALRIAFADGTEQDYNIMLEVFRNSKDGAEVLRALASLCYFSDPALTARTLAMALTDEISASQLLNVFGAMAQIPIPALCTWEFVKRNWDTLKAKLSQGVDSMGPIIGLIVAPLVRDDLMEDMKAFFKSKDTASFSQKLEQSMDQLAVKLKWANRDGEDVENWLRSKGYMF